MGFPLTQAVKSLLAMLETRVQSLGLEDPLEREMATHSSILAWRIPWKEDPQASPWGCKESDMTEQITLFSVISASDSCVICAILFGCFYIHVSISHKHMNINTHTSVLVIS